MYIIKSVWPFPLKYPPTPVKEPKKKPNKDFEDAPF